MHTGTQDYAGFYYLCIMDVKIEDSWKQRLAPEFEKDYFRNLTDFVRQEYKTTAVYPRAANIFRAFDRCPFEELKVVVIGAPRRASTILPAILCGSASSP